MPLTLDDIFRIADYLNMDTDDFFNEYCTEENFGNAIPMAYLKRDDGCPFLEDNLCSIHFVKPLLCKYMPSTVFGSCQYLRSKMPITCAVHNVSNTVKINDTDAIKERYMVSMILTSIYYSAHGTFVYQLAKPYIYRILLINKNRHSIYGTLDEYKLKN